jgi:acetyl/propionyl-CoA carboxylase alpha subunit
MRTLLIANHGEDCACRHRAGYHTLGVFSEDDGASLYMPKVDKAHAL